ncbi:MAG: phospholipase D-like domain-containing protein [Desulfosporosinus sp.]
MENLNSKEGGEKLITIVNSPWKDMFFELIASSKENIKICSPFIKTSVVTELYKRKRPKVNVELVTNFNLANFHKRSSDLDAVNMVLCNNHQVCNFQHLHAKIYLFDENSVVITSANLTESGLQKNYEYGVFSNDIGLVNKVSSDYHTIKNHELCGNITSEIVTTIKSILSNMPIHKDIVFPANFWELFDSDSAQDDIFSGGADSIESSLSGWKLAIFRLLNSVPKNIFELKDVYIQKEYLQQQYPDNKNIEAKVRQQLQFLRELGLVKFLGSGYYKKLWI